MCGLCCCCAELSPFSAINYASASLICYIFLSFTPPPTPLSQVLVAMRAQEQALLEADGLDLSPGDVAEIRGAIQRLDAEIAAIDGGITGGGAGDGGAGGGDRLVLIS